MLLFLTHYIKINFNWHIFILYFSKHILQLKKDFSKQTALDYCTQKIIVVALTGSLSGL